MMWRPKDWKNPYGHEPTPDLIVLHNLEESPGFKTLGSEAYEAGANAMLSALRKYVFIPDEENE